MVVDLPGLVQSSLASSDPAMTIIFVEVRLAVEEGWWERSG